MPIRNVAAAAACACALLGSGGAASAADRLVERGQYLASELGGCTHCHMNDQGEMKGRPMGPPPPGMTVWADRSSAIGGLPAGRTRADVVYLLEHATYPNGARPRPPHHMHKEDAEAIAAWLASVKR